MIARQFEGNCPPASRCTVDWPPSEMFPHRLLDAIHSAVWVQLAKDEPLLSVRSWGPSRRQNLVAMRQTHPEGRSAVGRGGEDSDWCAQTVELDDLRRRSSPTFDSVLHRIKAFLEHYAAIKAQCLQPHTPRHLSIDLVVNRAVLLLDNDRPDFLIGQIDPKIGR
jgi:hypothetical protein